MIGVGETRAAAGPVDRQHRSVRAAPPTNTTTVEPTTTAEPEPTKMAEEGIASWANEEARGGPRDSMGYAAPARCPTLRG
jgi:hypothetical protein